MMNLEIERKSNCFSLFEKPKIWMGIFLFLATISFNFPAFADEVDVPFLASMEIMQSSNLGYLAEIPAQLKTLNDSYTELQQQYSRLTNINDSLKNYMTGDTGIENFMNGTSDMNSRLWSNDNWSDVLKAAGGANTQGFTQMQQQYQSTYPVVDKSQIGGEGIKDTDLIRAQYEQQKNISRAALAGSAYSYNTVNQHMQNVQSILSQIKSTPTEKASMDMNARLLAEVSYIQLEMLKNQDMQTQLIATESQGQVNGMSDESKFAQWKSE